MNRKDSHRGLFFFASGIAALASQKNHMAVYLMSIYGDRTTLDWFVRAYAATGKRMDMGKSCVRFKRLDDLPLDVIGEAVTKVTPEQLIALHQKWHGAKKRKENK